MLNYLNNSVGNCAELRKDLNIRKELEDIKARMRLLENVDPKK